MHPERIQITPHTQTVCLGTAMETHLTPWYKQAIEEVNQEITRMMWKIENIGTQQMYCMAVPQFLHVHSVFVVLPGDECRHGPPPHHSGAPECNIIKKLGQQNDSAKGIA